MGCNKCAPTALSDDQTKVLKAFAATSEACGSKVIAEAAGMESKQVSKHITALKKKGLVNSPVRCKYAITTEGKQAIA